MLWEPDVTVISATAEMDARGEVIIRAVIDIDIKE